MPGPKLPGLRPDKEEHPLREGSGEQFAHYLRLSSPGKVPRNETPKEQTINHIPIGKKERSFMGPAFSLIVGQ